MPFLKSVRRCSNCKNTSKPHLCSTVAMFQMLTNVLLGEIKNVTAMEQEPNITEKEDDEWILVNYLEREKWTLKSLLRMHEIIATK